MYTMTYANYVYVVHVCNSDNNNTMGIVRGI